jgi:hypothetical protein
VTDDSSGKVLPFPSHLVEPPADARAEETAPAAVPIIGRKELHELVTNVTKLLDAFDLYVIQVRTLARVARDHPDVNPADIDRIIRNAEVDAKRLGEIRAAYCALAGVLEE